METEYEYDPWMDDLEAKVAQIQATFDRLIEAARNGKTQMAQGLPAAHGRMSALKGQLRDRQAGIHRVACENDTHSVCVCGLKLRTADVKAMSTEEYRAHPGHRA